MSDSDSSMSAVETMEIGGGNTNSPPKRVSQGKKWCFTYNNYPEDALEIMERNFTLHECEYIMGVEVGESGTPHLQGFIEAKKRLRPFELGLSRKIRWEKCKGTLKQNVAYCSKDGDVRHSKACKPKRPFKNILIDNPSLLTPWQKGILTEIESEPDDRTLNWYWSREGGVGKTTFCKFLSHKHGGIPINGKGADVRNGILSYMQANDGDWPELVLMNVPKCLESEGGGYISYEALENIKDMYFYSGKYEGGCVNGNPPHIYIFANFPPDESKMTVDTHGKHRFKIVDLDNLDRGLKRSFADLKDS